MADRFETPAELVKTHLPKIAEGDCYLDPEVLPLEQWFPGTQHPKYLEIHRLIAPEFEFETMPQEIREAYSYIPDRCPFAGLEQSRYWCEIGFFGMDDAPLVLFVDHGTPRLMYLANFEPKGVWADTCASFEEFSDALSIKGD